MTDRDTYLFTAMKAGAGMNERWVNKPDADKLTTLYRKEGWKVKVVKLEDDGTTTIISDWN